MDTYDEMTGIFIEDTDKYLEKISEDGVTAVKQVKKLLEDEFPEFRISGPNGKKIKKYWSIKKNNKNILILEDYYNYNNGAEKGLLTTWNRDIEEFYKKGYDKLNWSDMFYSYRRKYDTKGKSLDEIRSIFNQFK